MLNGSIENVWSVFVGGSSSRRGYAWKQSLIMLCMLLQRKVRYLSRYGVEDSLYSK